MNQTKDIDFSNKDRSNRVQRALSEYYDLIVIGGGITGVGIALDASLRGIKTLLVEKGDFASGTSSKSTKLIHGGLRYLKQLDFGLVKESGRERAVVHHNIPHLVHPERMLLPIVKNGSFNRFSASIAISVYDWLAKVKPSDRKVYLNKEATAAYEPLLKQSIIKSGINYSEYRTDDARLSIEIIKAARREGAEAFNYMEVDSFVYREEKICGVKCIDRVTDEVYTFEAKQIVSAAGPWVDKLRSKEGVLKGNTLRLTKGVHIVVPREKLNLTSTTYFDAFDKRMLFAIPRGKITYIGTSDTEYNNDLDRVVCSLEDAEYLISKVNQMFEDVHLTTQDIISSWAGLRPLIHEAGKSPTELSRKDEIFVSDKGLISIAGGKLTGYRMMAKRIVDLLQKIDPTLESNPCTTEHYSIHSDSFVDYEDYQQYKSDLVEKIDNEYNADYWAWYLTSTYGKNAKIILAKAQSMADIEFVEALIVSEIAYVIQYESAVYPEDYFSRRSGKLYFDIDLLKENFNFIIAEFTSYFEWSEVELQSIILRCKSLINDACEMHNEI